MCKKQQKSKAIALTFLLFFAHLLKMEEVAKSGRKVKAIALLFERFSPLFQKKKKWLKMDEKLS
jgi:hypothetical protein